MPGLESHCCWLWYTPRRKATPTAAPPGSTSSCCLISLAPRALRASSPPSCPSLQPSSRERGCHLISGSQTGEPRPPPSSVGGRFPSLHAVHSSTYSAGEAELLHSRPQDPVPSSEAQKVLPQATTIQSLCARLPDLTQSSIHETNHCVLSKPFSWRISKRRRAQSAPASLAPART